MGPKGHVGWEEDEHGHLGRFRGDRIEAENAFKTWKTPSVAGQRKGAATIWLSWGVPVDVLLGRSAGFISESSVGELMKSKLSCQPGSPAGHLHFPNKQQ